MQASCFYQIGTHNAISLGFISQDALERSAIDISADERLAMTTQQFNGGLGELCFISNPDGALNKVWVGIGLKNEATALTHAVNRLPEGRYTTTTPLSTQALLSWSLAQYKFDRYKKNPTAPKILSLTETDFQITVAEAEAIFLVRDLINTPTNDMGPAEMADVLENLANQHHATFKQWVGEELLEHQFPAIHAVGRASSNLPRLLSLTYGTETNPKITLVGKGVCFDSGGLDLKPSAHMRLMKKDMGGAAQVIGLAALLMARQLPIRLQVLIPAVENSVGSNAYRPGDILTMRNGLTVEIDNTDAEGRLVIADALVKACEDAPELLIDFTTLTGAARVAVGTEISALFTNDDALAAALMKTSTATADPIWRLPLYEDYESLFESSIADLSNSSSSAYAGAITAALFLQHFVTKGTPWAHFDVMAWNVRNKPGRPEGGEAMGLRAVAAYLIERYPRESP
jgi:leucyl aminopeptidase